MRTCSLIISLAVVVTFNASFFRIAKQAFAAPLTGASLAQYQEQDSKFNTSCVGDENAIRQCYVKKIQDITALAPTVGLVPAWKNFEPLDPLGWPITIVLLSAGAPFWQDILQSLFGLKNKLRSRQAVSSQSVMLRPATSEAPADQGIFNA